MRLGRIGDAVAVPLLDQPGGARIERLDRRHRRAVRVEQIEPVAVAGRTYAGDVAALQAALLQHLAHQPVEVGTQPADIALHHARRRAMPAGVAMRRGQRPAGIVEQHRLDAGVAGVDAEKGAHFLPPLS